MERQNRLSTLLGIIIGISSVLVANQLIDEKIGGTESGVGTVFLGYLVREREQEH
jgi:hypothetical protein